MVVIVSLSIAIGMALGRFVVQTSKWRDKSTKRRADLADCMRTVRALDEMVEDLRMYAEQDACEIERLRMLGDRLVNAVHFLLDGTEPTGDLAGVLAVWARANHD